MRKLPILLLLLLTTATAWTPENVVDFTNSALPENCDINVTEIVMSEAVNEPSWKLLEQYSHSNTSPCSSFVRGAWHYFQLTDPAPDCELLHQRVHEWWDLWNWRFEGCTTFDKAMAEEMVASYQTAFEKGDFNFSEPVEQNQTYEPTRQPENLTDDFFGGGFSATKEDFFPLLILVIVVFLIAIASKIILGGASKFMLLSIFCLGVALLYLDKSIFLDELVLIGIEVVFLISAWSSTSILTETHSFIESLNTQLGATPMKTRKREWKFSFSYFIYIFIILNVGFWATWIFI